MSGFVIQYTDIYNMLWAYQSRLENFMEITEQCQKSITALIENPNFQGAAATAIKSYLNDVHLTILSSFQVTAQNLLDNIVLYKAGYYDIDNSTNFILPEETIKEFRSRLSSNCLDTEEQGGNVRSALYGIADLYDGELPNSSKVSELHEQMDKELLKLVSDIEHHESSTAKALENSAVQLMTALKNCIGTIGTTFQDINTYQNSSFYTNSDACALAGLSQFFYQQHEDHHAVYDEIWKSEQAYKDAAEERETQGIWKTIGGGVLAVTGTVCIVATGGAATPVAAAGWAAAGGGTIAFGISDSVEGAQDIYYGSMGDIDSTAINGLRDTIFMGNEEAYYFAENLFAFSASAAIPISQAARAGNLTFRLGAATVAKEGISVAAGEGASRLTMELSGNRTASMVAGILASGAAGHGLNAVDGKFNISGNKGGSSSTYSSKEWYDYFNETYGKENVEWSFGEINGIKARNIKIIDSETATANWAKMGYTEPPYKARKDVYTFNVSDETEFVRVYSYKADGTSNKLGGWLMRKKDIEGLSASEIADKYALPQSPTHICDVQVPKGFSLEVGEANGLKGWGNGGGIQFDTMGKFIEEDAFVNERLIGE